MSKHQLTTAICLLAIIFTSTSVEGDEPAESASAPVTESETSETERQLAAGWDRYNYLLQQQNFAAALDELAAIVDAAKYGLPEGDGRTSALVLNYARMLDQLGHEADADIAFEDARELYVAQHGEDGIGLVPLLMAEGDRAAGPGKSRAQKAIYKDALAIVADEYGSKSVQYGEISVDAGMRIANLSRSNLGTSMVRDALNIFEDELGLADLRTSQAHMAMAQLSFAKGKVNTADKHLEKAIAGMDTSTTEGRDKVIETRRYLVRTYVRIQRDSKATSHLQELARLMSDGKDQAPVVLARLAPDYPEHLAATGASARLRFAIEVNEQGFVTDYQLIDNNGAEEFVGPARKAVKKYRYAPAIENGELVAGSTEAIVDFNPALLVSAQDADFEPMPQIVRSRVNGSVGRTSIDSKMENTRQGGNRTRGGGGRDQ